jgi:hypothetical protein
VVDYEKRQRMIAALKTQGYSVFRRSELPDLLCVRGGAITLVKFSDGVLEEDSLTVAKFAKLGVKVDVRGQPVNPNHQGKEKITSFSVSPENQPYFDVLRKKLKVRGMSLSGWVAECAVREVSQGITA